MSFETTNGESGFRSVKKDALARRIQNNWYVVRK